MSSLEVSDSICALAASKDSHGDCKACGMIKDECSKKDDDSCMEKLCDLVSKHKLDDDKLVAMCESKKGMHSAFTAEEKLSGSNPKCKKCKIKI